MMNENWFSRLALCCALAGGMALTTASFAHADMRNDCNHRLDVDRARIDRDVSHHGEHSRQVEKDVARMDSDRQWCRDHKVDWDHDRYDRDNYMHH